MSSSAATMPRRLTAALGAGAVVAGLALVAAPGAAAQPAPAAAATAPGITLTSRELAVQVSTTFPQVLSYTDRRTGASLGGQPDPLTSLTVDGTPRRATVAVSHKAGSAAYTLTFADLPGVSIALVISVDDDVVGWRVTRVADTAEHRVGTIEVPALDLVSVSSDQEGATTAFTRIDTDSTRDADVVAPVRATDAPQAAPVGAAYGIVNTARLAASVETNGTYDKPTGNGDNLRLWHQVRAGDDGSRRVGIAPGQWTVRGDGAPQQSELPWAKVVVTGDRNGDRSVDWQDGAIAFRAIEQRPQGAADVADRVVQHIPFNFGSLATHPFLRTLDDVKRISLATDGLGQFALLKGYAAEGHDSAHPDYAGNYNERAGGLKDLNTLLAQGKKWGADFGVHVNATEAYPEARAFDETLVDKTKKGWNWLNQSYYIDQRRDLNSGDLLRRTQQLRKDTKGNLDLLYWDVYYTYGWIPDSMDAALRKQGWQVASEWAYSHERNSLWSHWATDRNYGGATNKGINSTIVRFIRNGEKDVWNPDPILGGSTIVEAEGWTGQHDWNALMDNVWRNQLATKFLQHFDITRWSDHDIAFSDGVRGSDATGTRQLFVGDAKVLDGDAYLLPWGEKGPQKADRAYHYNADGGTTMWKVPSFLGKNVRSFTVYRLDDTGRHVVGTLPVRGGTVTITAQAGTAYVLYPARAPRQTDADWGQGGPVSDPGFNAGTLTAWHPTGAASVQTSDRGAHEAVLGAGPAGLHQQLRGLTRGKRYAASAWVEVEPGATRATTLRVTGKGVDVANTVQRSTLPNYVASDEKQGTSFQRVRVIFTAPPGGRVDLSISAADGAAPVGVDDVRVVQTTEAAPTGRVIARQDYEGVDQGWLPFVSGPAQRGGDAQTHVSRLHAPFTQAGWNGKLVDDVLDGEWSLKAHEEATGLIYRTWQGTVPFQASHRYRVEFDYQNATAGAYSLVVGADRPDDGSSEALELSTTAFGQQRTTARYSGEFTTGACGDHFLGVRRNAVGGSQADFILDDLVVTDLGASAEPGACAGLVVAGPKGGLVPGEADTVTATFTNHEAQPAAQTTIGLTLPDGWSAAPVGATTFASVAPEASVKATWRVVVPATTAPGDHAVTATAAYTVGGGQRSTTSTGRVTTLPAGLVPQSRLSIAGVSDSEPGSGDGSPSAAIDGNASTMWHSAWSQVDPDTPYPHWITVDLGDVYDIDGYDYQVRIGNGAIKGYELYVSTDNQAWGEPVRTGTFASTTEVQHLDLPTTRGRYLKLVGLGSVNGAAFAGAGEINVWGKRVNQAPVPLPKDGMTVVDVDSQETEGEDGAASNAIDDDPSTFWHTQWLDAEPGYPHHLTVDLGAPAALTGITVQGRPGSAQNGRIKDYEVYVSADGTDWGASVAHGTFTGSTAPQNVSFSEPATGRFVKVVGLSSLNGANFAAIAELQFYGEPQHE